MSTYNFNGTIYRKRINAIEAAVEYWTLEEGAPPLDREFVFYLAEEASEVLHDTPASPAEVSSILESKGVELTPLARPTLISMSDEAVEALARLSRSYSLELEPSDEVKEASKSLVVEEIESDPNRLDRRVAAELEDAGLVDVRWDALFPKATITDSGNALFKED
jgi:hypothetical protein